MYFGKQILNAGRFQASLDLGRHVVKALAKDLKLGLDTNIAGSGILVEPGIIARNLFIPKEVTKGAVSYIECLYYNDTKEFNAFRLYTHNFYINGKNYPYSDRLNEVTIALQKGVLSYVKSHIEH